MSADVPDLAAFRRTRKDPEDISHMGPTVLLKRTSIKPATYREAGQLTHGLVIGFERLDGDVSVMFHTIGDLEKLYAIVGRFLEEHSDGPGSLNS